ncbi:MAG: DUF4215 domain-containing protein [Nannocystaceae bacterium]
MTCRPLLACALLPLACFSPTQLDNETESTSGSGSTGDGTASTTASTSASTTASTTTAATETTTADPDTSGGSSDGSTTAPLAHCGDNNLDDGEECDDGNEVVGDGCSAACVDETQTCDTALVGGANIANLGRMVAAGGYLYAVPGFDTNATGLLRIVDATDPATPSQIATFAPDPKNYPFWRARGIAMRDDHVWIAGSDPEFLSVDVADPSTPVLGDIDGPNDIDGHVAIQGDLMLTAESVGDQARLYDISDPTSAMFLSLIGSYVEYNVALHGTWAFVYGGPGVEIWDITVPAVPALTGLAELDPGTVRRMVASDETVFVASSVGPIRAIDYSQPDFPQEFAIDVGAASDIALLGDFLYVPITNGLDVYDVSSPQDPVKAGTYLQIDAYTTTVALDPPYAYLATDAGLRIVQELPGLCEARCGNAFIEYPEQCDDGNLDPADGCDACTDA